MKILLIEENPVVSKVLGQELKNDGYDITVSNSADIIDTPGFNIQEYDAVITDFEPKLTNGLHVIRKIELTQRSIPCLIHSWKEVVEKDNRRIILKDLETVRSWVTVKKKGLHNSRYLREFLTGIS